jgi:hypothetical protein
MTDTSARLKKYDTTITLDDGGATNKPTYLKCGVYLAADVEQVFRHDLETIVRLTDTPGIQRKTIADIAQRLLSVLKEPT